MSATGSRSLDVISMDWAAPQFIGSDAVIANADCLVEMKRIPSRSVDLIATSPPYNIGMPYEKVLPLSDYLEWLLACLAEMERILAPTGSLWLNLGYLEVPGRGHAVPIAYPLWDRLPMFLVQEVVWHFKAGVPSTRRMAPRNEKLLWLAKDPEDYVFNLDAIRDPDVKYPNQKRNGKLRCNVNGKNPSDVWCIPRVTGGKRRRSKERTDHPAQMPLAVAERIVKGSSNPGDVVFDPFAGSGTTGVAALRHDRYFAGFELDLEYCELAATRLARANS